MAELISEAGSFAINEEVVLAGLVLDDKSVAPGKELLFHYVDHRRIRMELYGIASRTASRLLSVEIRIALKFPEKEYNFAHP